MSAPPTTAAEVIKAAMSLASDAAEGTLDPDALDVELTTACRELFGVVVGKGDPAWRVQIDVARQVLSLGGLSLDELREWQAVLEQRENGPDSPVDGPATQLPAEGRNVRERATGPRESTF